MPQEKKVKLFCVPFFGIMISIGAIMYYIFGKSLLGGLGLSSAIISLVSLFHFTVRRTGSDKIESKLTFILLVCCVLGVAIIFINKFRSGPTFIYGLGAGVSLMAGISYVFELIANLKDNIR